MSPLPPHEISVETLISRFFPSALAWMGLNGHIGGDSGMLFAGNLLCLLLLPNLAWHLLGHRTTHSRRYSSLANFSSRLSGTLDNLWNCMRIRFLDVSFFIIILFRAFDAHHWELLFTSRQCFTASFRQSTGSSSQVSHCCEDNISIHILIFWLW